MSGGKNRILATTSLPFIAAALLLTVALPGSPDGAGTALALSPVKASPPVAPHPYYPGIKLPRPEKLGVASESERSAHPVILITIDALRPDRLTPYGHSRDTSPALARLAADGVTFTNAFSTCTWTGPAVGSILTSLHPSEHGSRWDMDTRHLAESHVTVAERFKAAGYTTAAFTGNRMARRWNNFTQGFDFVREVDHPYARQPDAELLLKDAGDWMAAHVKKHPEKPFFVWVFLIDPHDPYEAPAPFTSIFGAAPKDTPRRPHREYKAGENLSKAMRAGLLNRYDGEIRYMDSELEKFFFRLKDLELWEKTTLAMSADHGEAFGNHNCYLHAWHLWDDVARVPMLIRSPVLRSGRGGRSDDVVSLIDLAPTLARAAGLDVPATWKGVSLWPSLADPGKRPHEAIYAEVDAFGVRRAMARSDHYKVIYHHPVVRPTFDRMLGHPSAYPSVAMDSPRVELFDVRADPKEDRATVGSTNENTRRLLGLLKAHLPGAMAP